MPEQTADTRAARFLLIALLLIIALGAALRMYRLGAESFWLDEAYSVELASFPTSEVLHELVINDVHPPLYYFVVHFWIKLFGDSEWSVRFISVLFGVLAIPLIFLLALQLFDRVTGLFAAALLALSQFHIGFSQEGRMYAMLVSLTLLSFYFFLKLLEGKRSRLAFVAYVASSTLMMHTHIYSFFIIIAQNIYFLTLAFTAKEIFKRSLKRWLLAQLVLALLFVPWFFALLRQVSRVRRGFWIPDEPPRAILDALYLHAGSTNLAWVLFPLVAFAVLSAWKGVRKEAGVPASQTQIKDGFNSERLKIYLLLLWLVCPIILPFLVSKFSSPIFLPKYTIPALPAFIILAARGLSRVRFHQLRMLAAVFILCFSLIALRNYYGTVRKDQWRDAVSGLEQKAEMNDLILLNPPSSIAAFDYYSKRTDLVKIPFPDYKWDFKAETVAQYLKPVVEGRRRVWLLLSQQNQLSPLISKHLGESYDLKAHGIYSGVETFLFEKRK
jgi:uncharacterized membrane protein